MSGVRPWARDEFFGVVEATSATYFHAMTARATEGFHALTEREKQTLRLIVRGHDAKSIARSLDLSVHTVNERLRDARRKLSVSSSREAARMVLQAEGGRDPFDPKSSGDMQIGDAATAVSAERRRCVDWRRTADTAPLDPCLELPP